MVKFYQFGKRKENIFLPKITKNTLSEEQQKKIVEIFTNPSKYVYLYHKKGKRKGYPNYSAIAKHINTTGITISNYYDLSFREKRYLKVNIKNQSAGFDEKINKIEKYNDWFDKNRTYKLNKERKAYKEKKEKKLSQRKTKYCEFCKIKKLDYYRREGKKFCSNKCNYLNYYYNNRILILNRLKRKRDGKK